MFDKNAEKEKTLGIRAENKLIKEMITAISEAALNSDIPENKKICLRILNASMGLENLVHDTISELIPNSENINAENARKYLLMLIACHNQLKAFLESNPLTTNEASENGKEI